jgi:dsRNA-specific ribonuclease
MCIHKGVDWLLYAHGRNKAGHKREQHSMIYTYKAVTFNANIVIGKGATSAEAKADAAKKAADLGSCIRKRI